MSNIAGVVSVAATGGIGLESGTDPVTHPLLGLEVGLAGHAEGVPVDSPQQKGGSS